MERRVTSHTEEEEMNQRRRLLMLARKGDQKAVESLFELYQVRVFSGEALKKKKLPSFPLPPTGPSGRGSGKAGKKMVKIPKVSSLDVIPRTEPAMLPQEPKKKSGLPTKLTGKTKGPKPSAEKPKKGRPLSAKKVTPKVGKSKKAVSVAKGKPKKPTLSARPTRVKKK
jgi:hypothetical protein